MKRKGKIWFFVVAILIFFLAYSAFFGITTKFADIETPIIKSASDIRFGIDIRGGVDVSFVPAVEEIQATPEQMDAAQAVVEQRLISLGIADYELYKDAEQGRLILRFPWREDETDFDPETAIQELSTAAILTFREGYEVDETTGEMTGVTAENIILQGTDVTQATSRYGTLDGNSNEYFVELKLSPEGQAKFSEATARLAAEGGSISIWMDNSVISNPSVNSAITGDTAVITGNFTAESAKELADQINAGSLPFALQAESYSTISPVLGSQSLRAMVIAGIVAFILIAAFMIFNYRLPGFVSSISLLGQTAGTIALISGYFAVFQSSTLTLPGIAGIILAIGIGVDANVITAERIKEELRGGKKLDAAIKSGFQRGLAPIVDSNVTVLIVSAILMGAFGTSDGFFGWLFNPIFRWFGTSTAGSIYSFGYTLMAGVLLNFVFGVGCTRVMLTSISKLKKLRNPWLYGGLKSGQVEKVDKPFNIVGKRRISFTLSIVLIAVIVIASFGMGVSMDVQFRGGAIVSYSYIGNVDLNEATALVDETLGTQATLQTGSGTYSGSTLTITLPGTDTLDAASLEKLTAALNETYSVNNFTQLEVNNVDPVIGQAFLLKCMVAVLAAMVLILIYVAFRFRRIGGWRGGVTALVALLHDLIIVYGVFVLLGIPLSGNFIAALLTILGYSINDTVVIYDRVRENRSLYGRRMPFGELVNLSINQSLKRSVNTTLTTLMALGCVCIFALVFGLGSIFSFAFPMMIGMISGVYSTVCIAGPLWVSWEERRVKKTQRLKSASKAKALPADKKDAKQDDKKADAAKKDDKTSDAKDTKDTAAKKQDKPAKASDKKDGKANTAGKPGADGKENKKDADKKDADDKAKKDDTKQQDDEKKSESDDSTEEA